MVKRLARQAEVDEWERVSPHTLRHTYATNMIRETKNLRLVQKALGHADISTTQIYTNIVDEELEQALRSFGFSATCERNQPAASLEEGAAP